MTLRWLEEKIYPAEDRLTPESVRVGSELAIAEMIRGGTVSFSDMYFFCEETAEAALALGVKANISRCLVSFDPADGIRGNSRFEEAARLRDRLRAVSNLENRQRVIATARADTDAVGFQRGARCCFTARLIPRLNSALSSKREFDQAGPLPSLFTV